jgi:uncharacterized membrane protein
MSTLTVLRFTTVDGAEIALARLVNLEKRGLITLQDAAVVSWPEGQRKPKTRQIHNLVGSGALDGAVWGLLFGLLFFVPFLGMAIGALTGALTGALKDVGINDSFIEQVRRQVIKGTSALFVLSRWAVVDRVVAELASLQPEVIATNLPTEQVTKLKGLFA